VGTSDWPVQPADPYYYLNTWEELNAPAALRCNKPERGAFPFLTGAEAIPY
jgi:hypothetical protein